jgi:hypothetical protein
VAALRLETPRQAFCGQLPLLSRVFALVLAGLAWVMPSHAVAGQSARLVYSRTAEASSCPDEHGLRQAVARRLGYDPFVAASMNTVVAELRGEGEGEGLKARVYVIREGNQAGGSRELASPSRDCTELLAAIALAISIAVDPDALDRIEQTPAPAAGSASGAEKQPDAPAPVDAQVSRQTKPEQPPAPSAATTNGKSPEKLPSRTPIASPSESHQEASFSVGVAASGATKGPAPWPSVGMSLFASVRLRNWAVFVEPEATVPSTSEPKSSGSKVRIWTIGGNASGGYWFGPLYVGALFDAVVLNAQGLNAQGHNVDSPKRAHPLLASAGLRLGYALNLTKHLAVVARADGLIALRPLEMKLNVDSDNSESLYKTPPAFARFGLGLDYGF